MQIHRDRKQNRDYQGLSYRSMSTVFVGDGKQVLGIDSGDGCTRYEYV